MCYAINKYANFARSCVNFANSKHFLAAGNVSDFSYSVYRICDIEAKPAAFICLSVLNLESLLLN